MNTSKLIIGNWKMNPEKESQSIALVRAIVKNNIKGAQTIIAVPYVFISPISKEIKGSKVMLASQDISFFENGAHTGDVSGVQLKNLGVKYVIIGHSERRVIGDTNEIINKKIQNALKNGLTPVLCVGELERDSGGKFFSVVGEQIRSAFLGIPKTVISRVVIAYEPVWALSTTENRHDVTVEDSREMVLYIRKILADVSNPKIAGSTQIIYGGSANSLNAEDLLLHGGVSGLLVGKASLDKNEFIKIITIAKK